jgi:uncharacterized membrane protein
MTKSDFLTELRQRLHPLPLTHDDISDALQYYEEYFTEAGPEREQEVLSELGSPAYVAAQIALKLTGTLTPAPERGKKKPKNMTKAILLGVAAAPVALPLLIGAMAVLFALVATGFALALTFGITGAVLAAASVPAFVFAFTQLPGDVITGLYWVGGSLFMFGLGGFMLVFCRFIGRVFYKAITAIGAKMLRRDGKGKERAPETIITETRKETVLNAQEN